MSTTRVTLILGAVLAFLVGLPLATVGADKLMKPAPVTYVEVLPAPVATPAVPAAEKSIFAMTQAERKAAYLARQDATADRPTEENRARWACSARLKEAAHVPGSVEWTRRSQWPVVQARPGVFEVQAEFTASNRLGVALAVAKRCRVIVSDEAARVVKVS
jgi:hypothetical protein